MNKKVILLSSLVVISLAIFVFFLFFYDRGVKDGVGALDTEKTEIQEEDLQPEKMAGMGSLSGLSRRGENLECSITYKNNDAPEESVEGSFFTSRERIRGDFLTTDNGQQILSSIIIRDDMMYSWSEIDGQKYGMKVDLKELEKMEAQGETPDTREPVPLDDTVQYDCKPWNNVDGSVFEEPRDIVFSDFSAVIGTGMEFGTIYEDQEAGNQGSCEVCKMLPAGTDRNECLRAMMCN